MCGLKAAQTHGQPLMAAKESSAAFGCTRFLFALRQKDLMFNRFIINDCCPAALRGGKQCHAAAASFIPAP